MQNFYGRVIEIKLDPDGDTAAWIACNGGAPPTPGRYVTAWAPEETHAPLAVPLFPAQISGRDFLTAPPVPANWGPGTRLALRGPLGHGFHPPTSTRRLALAALGETTARLQPLMTDWLAQDAALALFTDCPLPPLPAAIEVYPLGSLPEALAWADFLALDLPASALPELRSRLGLSPQGMLPCPAQALLYSPMPCGGLAACGVCAVPARRAWKLACENGPVFDINYLGW